MLFISLRLTIHLIFIATLVGSNQNTGSHIHSFIRSFSCWLHSRASVCTSSYCKFSYITFSFPLCLVFHRYLVTKSNTIPPTKHTRFTRKHKISWLENIQRFPLRYKEFNAFAHFALVFLTATFSLSS